MASGSDREGGRLRWLDCNARIGAWSNPQPEQFMDAKGLADAWDRVGIEGGLVYHAWGWEWSPARANEILLEEVAAEPRMRPCYVALPHATQEMEPVLRFAAQVRQSRGAVRIFPAKHGWSTQDWCGGALFDALQTANVPLLVDITQAGWDAIAGILAGHPRLNVIVLETFYRVDRMVYPLMERYPKLHLEATTYAPFMGPEAIVSNFGAERLVFGTAMPELEAGGPMALVAYADVSEEDRAKIAGGNLLRLLGEEE